MFMPFSLGKNQNRTIWSENKIWWRNYCKVRFHCFLPISFFKVSLVVGFLFVCFVSFFWYLSVEDKRGGRGSGVQIFLECIVILWPPIERSGVILVYSTQFPGCGMTVITLPVTNQTTQSDIFGRLLPFCACVLEHAGSLKNVYPHLLYGYCFHLLSV